MTKAHYTTRTKGEAPTFHDDTVLFTHHVEADTVEVANRSEARKRFLSASNHVATMRQPASYRAVQRECKRRGLSAKGSLNVLRIRLWQSEHTQSSTEPSIAPASKPAPKQRPAAKPATNKAPRPEPVAAIKPDYSYRAMQRLVTWAKANVVGYQPIKNVGTANVTANFEALYANTHFIQLLTRQRYRSQVATLLTAA